MTKQKDKAAKDFIKAHKIDPNTTINHKKSLKRLKENFLETKPNQPLQLITISETEQAIQESKKDKTPVNAL